MFKLRILLGILSIFLSVVYLAISIIALESKGRINGEEFFLLSFCFFIIALLIALWAWFNGDAEDKKDLQNNEPNIF
jgi:hypothetical protein